MVGRCSDIAPISRACPQFPAVGVIILAGCVQAATTAIPHCFPYLNWTGRTLDIVLREVTQAVIREQNGQAGSLMRPLYADRGPKARVECIACGHDEMIPRIGLVVGLRLPASIRVLDLQSRFRCRDCDRRGSVALSIRWAGI